MIISRPIHVPAKWHYFNLFYGPGIFHCVYISHLLSPCLCQWTFRLPPSLGYCKHFRSECWGACVLSNSRICHGGSESRSVVSNSLRPHGLYSPWNSPGQNTGEGSLPLLQGIFPTQGSSSGLPRCGQILYQLSQSHGNTLLTKRWVCLPSP